jgi:DNA polymerase zeta
MGHEGNPAATAAHDTIDRFYLSRHCAVCDGLTRAQQPLCDACKEQPDVSAAVLAARVTRLERQHQHLVRLCLHCGGGGGSCLARQGGVVCDSVACGVWYERSKVANEWRALAQLAAAGLEGL